MPRTTRAMTRAELLALPAALDLVTAGQVLGLGRSKAYEMAQNGQWPTRLLRLGNAYRVPTAELLALLGIEPTGGPQRDTGGEAA
jgi:predicted DNA-binding transcriptional regulator AlpA